MSVDVGSRAQGGGGWTSMGTMTQHTEVPGHPPPIIKHHSYSHFHTQPYRRGVALNVKEAMPTAMPTAMQTGQEGRAHSVNEGKRRASHYTYPSWEHRRRRCGALPWRPRTVKREAIKGEVPPSEEAHAARRLERR